MTYLKVIAWIGAWLVLGLIWAEAGFLAALAAFAIGAVLVGFVVAVWEKVTGCELLD